jgi:hypothetical protein
MKGGKNMPGFVAKEGYYPFVGIFNWDFTVDEAAGARFEEAFVLLKESKDFDGDSMRGFYLTGERCLVLSGYTKSPVALERFCKSVIFNSAIEVNFYHAVEVHDLKAIYGSAAA